MDEEDAARVDGSSAGVGVLGVLRAGLDAALPPTELRNNSYCTPRPLSLS